MSDSKDKNSTQLLQDNFQNMIPRTIFAEADTERLDKTGQTFTGDMFSQGAYTQGLTGGNILRNPARRFYDPEITTTAIYLPRNIRQKNRWCRWFFDHDELVGAVLELHAELPYSRAEIVLDDPSIKRHVEECIDRTKFFSELPLIDLEFMKIGEVFIHTPWDDSKGMWSHIIIHNPDFIEVKETPFADSECIIEVKPDNELKQIIHSTKPEEQQLKKRLPKDVVRRVLTGKNILLDSDEVTHIARRSNPYDIRGTSILNRLFRCYVPGTGVRMFDGTLKHIEDVVKGDYVLSLNGEKREVIDTVSYDINDKVIEIKHEKSPISLVSTKGHKYKVQVALCACGCGTELTYKQIKRGVNFIHGHNLNNDEKITTPEYVVKEIEAQDIKMGNCLIIPINNEVKGCAINKEKARLLGYFLSIGSLKYEKNHRKSYVEWVFDIYEKELFLQDLVTILGKEFNISPTIYDGHNNNLCFVKIVKEEDYNKIHNFLIGEIDILENYNKRLKEDVLYYPKDIQKEIIIGAFRAEATKAKKFNELILVVTSKEIAEQIQWLLFRCNFYSSITLCTRDSLNFTPFNPVKKLKMPYLITVPGNYSTKLERDCFSTRQFGINRSVKPFYNRIRNDENYFYVPVKSVEEVKYKGKVHDITVDVNHWWLVGEGVQTSNTLMYEDKLREAQLSISDNFIYPLKVFKLGDPQRGWIPDNNHQKALAQMLQQANFDPNFSLIYHYGLSVDYITVADKVMRLEKEWDEINNKKMIALGVSKEFMQGTSTYACLTEGTKVATPTGYANIEDITIGNTVIDKDGVEQKVIDNWDEGKPKSITRISLWGGKTIECTDNHKWPVLRLGDRRLPLGNAQIQKLRSDEIIEYDYLMIPRKFNEDDYGVSKTSARLLGYFIADGSRFSFGDNEDTWMKGVINLCNIEGIPLYGMSKPKIEIHLRSSVQSMVKSRIKWFKEQMGGYTPRQQLSDQVMRWPVYLKKELVIGLFRGAESNKQISITEQQSVYYITESETLAYQLELILAQIGIPVNWTVQDNKYRLDIYSKFAAELVALVWGKGVQFKFDKSKKFYGQKAFVDENYVYLMVRSVESIKNTKKVYNLTVKNSHSYTANNIGTYNSANVGLQMQMARYKAKRDLFEYRWMMDKFFRIMAERNKWYKRDAKEIVGHYRVSRKGDELRQRLIMPKLMWNKKLMMRDDQQFLTYLNSVYAQGKGPVSAITFLMAMGLDLESELANKKRQKDLEEMVGEYTQPPAPAPAPSGGIPGAPPGLGSLASRIKNRFKTGKNTTNEDIANELKDKDSIEDELRLKQLSNSLSKAGSEFIAYANDSKNVLDIESVLEIEKTSDEDLTNDIIPINTDDWYKNIQSPNISGEAIFAISSYDEKLQAIHKKNGGNLKAGVLEESSNLLASLIDVYVQGKLSAYSWTDYLSVYKQHYAQNEELRDYSDIVLSNEFEDWIISLASMDMSNTKLYTHLRDLSNTCYCYGQLKGFEEQGIYNVKISNSPQMDGIRYKTNELKNKGKNLASVISNSGDIVLFAPCIEGFDDEIFGNNVDPTLPRYKNSVVNGIAVNDCPIEYFPFLERYLNKLGSYLKKSYTNVIFVLDVTKTAAWEKSQRDKFSSQSIDDEKFNDYLLDGIVEQERIKKLGKVPVFADGNTLYISNWIGSEDVPITKNFIKYIDIHSDSLRKAIYKNFTAPNFDLTADELNTYKMFGYIDPVYDNKENIIGWRVARATQYKTAVDEKVVLGKAWDKNGKCLSLVKKDAMQLYTENLYLWIDYPHKLSNQLKNFYEALL